MYLSGSDQLRMTTRKLEVEDEDITMIRLIMSAERTASKPTEMLPCCLPSTRTT